MPEALRLRELLQRLAEAEVRFILVGGLAVNAWGVPAAFLRFPHSGRWMLTQWMSN